MNTLNPIARAFELARSGICKDIDDLGRKLAREGYSGVTAHLSGRSLRRQLNDAIKASAGTDLRGRDTTGAPDVI
jgi:hypothetical protein